MSQGRRKTPPILTAVALMAAALVAVTSGEPARAATPDQPLAGTPSSMWQTNNTVYALAVSGGVVYAGGDFTSVRPPGSPRGSNETARTYLAGFNTSTGAVTGFSANVNGPVLGLAVSPDGSRLYAVGRFTSVNGQVRNRIAAFNLPSGTLVGGFAPSASSTVVSVAVSQTAVYVGGDFGQISGVARSRIASLNPANGAVNTGFTAALDNRAFTIAVDPANTRVLVGGSFTTVNGVAQRAMASLHPATGATMPWAALSTFPTSPFCSAIHITDIVVTGTVAYVVGEDEFPGCYDGTYAANIADGSLRWHSICWGASVAVEVVGGWLYRGSHTHDCGYDRGGFVGSQDRDEFVFHRLTAHSLSDGSLGHWSPNTNGFTSSNPIGPRVLATDGTQLFVGGDFSTVNNANQQGITRFTPGNTAVPDRPAAPTVVATAAGTLTLTFPAVADRDSGTLRYDVYRDNGSTPIGSVTAESWPWTLPGLRFDDTGLPAGTSHTYTVSASDGTRTSARSPASAAVTVNGTNPPSFAGTVLSHGPSVFWRLAEADPATPAADASPSGTTGTYVGGVTAGQPGAVTGDAAVGVNGTNGYVTSSAPITATATFSTSAWFRTTSLTGGNIVGFSANQIGGGGVNDRVVWMDNNGQLAFGLRQTNNRTAYVRGPLAYNDGNWHQVVATYNGSTISLYIDGTLAASGPATAAVPAPGYLRAGYTDLGAYDTVFGPNTSGRTAPNSFFFTGGLDEVALYPAALTPQQVRDQFVASVTGGVAPPPPPPPPPTGYAAVVGADNPSLYWRLAEPGAGTVGDSSGNNRTGTYRAGVTFGTTGALGTDNNWAVTGPGTSGVAYANSSVAGPATYSLELWFRSTSTSGGKLLGFENVQTGWGASYDRQLYLTNAGRIAYGIVSAGTRYVVETSGTYNNGGWHHVVATQGPGGMTLYVDGVVVGTNPTVTPDAYNGFWRLGGGNLTGWQNAPSSSAVAGSFDEAAVYPTALTAAQVNAHYAAATG